MSERQKRLYRAVVITAPEGDVPARSRTRWVYAPGVDEFPLLEHSYGDPPTRRFRPGQSRTYQLQALARAKAGLWAAHGCTVRVDESELVIWKQP